MKKEVRVAVVAGMFLGMAGVAVAQQVTGSYAKSFGNGDFGGVITAWGKLAQSPYLLAEGKLIGDVTLLNHTRQAVRVEARSALQAGTSSNRVRVYIDGFIVYSQDKNIPFPWNWATTQTLATYSQWFMISFVPVKVTASCGVGAQANITLGAVSPVSLSGMVKGYAWGTVSAGVTFPAAKATVTAQVNFFNQQLNASMTANPGQLSGSCTYQRTSITLWVTVSAEYWAPWTWGWVPIGTLTLATYSTPPQTKTLFSL